MYDGVAIKDSKWRLVQNLKVEPVHDPAVPHSGIYIQ